MAMAQLLRKGRESNSETARLPRYCTALAKETATALLLEAASKFGDKPAACLPACLPACSRLCGPT
jgi:hypothetical protein